MTTSMAIGIIKESVMMLIIITGAMIIPSFVVTLLISIFQATTQIQEQTLTFIPKLVITLLLVIFLGPIIVTKLSEHFLSILSIIGGA